MASAFCNETCVACKKPESEKDKLRTPITRFQQVRDYSEIFELNELNKTLIEARGEHSDHPVTVKIHVSCQKYIGNEIRKKKRRVVEIYHRVYKVKQNVEHMNLVLLTGKYIVCFVGKQ